MSINYAKVIYRTLVVVTLFLTSLTHAQFEGSGTKTDPFCIGSRADLEKLSKQVNEGNSFKNSYFKLTKDIDMKIDGKNVPFSPIGSTDTRCFSGILNGDNKTISNLCLRGKDSHYGLFGVINGGTAFNIHGESNGSIYNLTLKDVDINVEASFAGSLVGHMNLLGNIENCHVKGGNIVFIKNEGKERERSYVGGLIGGRRGYYAYKEPSFGQYSNSSIKNASVDSVKITSNTSAGGLVGYAIYTTFIECNTLIEISGEDVGGFAATISATCIDNSHSKGIIYGEIIGGFLGYTKSCIISNCSSAVRVCAKNAYKTASFIANCGDWYHGSASHLATHVKNCIATGDVDVSRCTGGFVGYISSTSTFDNCIFAGRIIFGQGQDSLFKDRHTDIGGFGGDCSSSVIKNCYWNKTINQFSDSYKVVNNALNVWDNESECALSDTFIRSNDFINMLNKNIANFSGISKGQLFNEWELSPQTNLPQFSSKLVSYKQPLELFKKQIKGIGTGDSPYQISSRSDLELLSNRVADGSHFKDEYFILTQDIDMRIDGKVSPFTPIGRNYLLPFSGHFNGNNKTIRYLYVNADNISGLFGVVSYHQMYIITSSEFAMISNLKLENTVINGKNGTCGSIVGHLGVGGRLSNCHVKNSTIKSTGDDVGGIAGCAAGRRYGREDYKKISKCVLENISIESTGDNVGGFIGIASSILVADCMGENISINGGRRVGGLVGQVNNSSLTNFAMVGTIHGVDTIGVIAGGITSYSKCKNIFTLTPQYDLPFAGYESKPKISGDTHRGGKKLHDNDEFGNEYNPNNKAEFTFCYKDSIIINAPDFADILNDNLEDSKIKNDSKEGLSRFFETPYYRWKNNGKTGEHSYPIIDD